MKVKFLLVGRWKEESVPKIRERMMKVKPPSLEGKYIFPMHTIVGTNSAFAVMETNSIEDVVKSTWPWTDLIKFDTRPIMDNMELAKFAQSAKL